MSFIGPDSKHVLIPAAGLILALLILYSVGPAVGHQIIESEYPTAADQIDEIIAIRSDGLVTLYSGEQKMLPDQLMDDFEQMDYDGFMDALHRRDVRNYRDLYSVDNLTSSIDYDKV